MPAEGVFFSNGQEHIGADYMQPMNSVKEEFLREDPSRKSYIIHDN